MKAQGEQKAASAEKRNGDVAEAAIEDYRKIPVKERLMRVLWLALTFLKIGAFTFGGGYAMISLIEKDVVDKRKWLSGEEMLDIIAIAEATPGAIALNTATYVGAKVAGFWGAMVASVCVLLPAVVIIIAISTVLDLFKDNQYIKWAFLGIRACVCALILNAVWKFFKAIKKSVYSYVIMGVAFVVAALSAFEVIDFDVVFIILIAAVFGIVYNYFVRKHKKKKALINADAESSEDNKSKVEAPENASSESQNANNTEENNFINNDGGKE